MTYKKWSNFRKPLSDAWKKCVCTGCGKVRYYSKSSKHAKMKDYLCRSCQTKKQQENKT